jgi:hypothetical protein
MTEQQRRERALAELARMGEAGDFDELMDKRNYRRRPDDHAGHARERPDDHEASGQMTTQVAAR